MISSSVDHYSGGVGIFKADISRQKRKSIIENIVFAEYQNKKHVNTYI
jgi:hypothetical protein